MFAEAYQQNQWSNQEGQRYTITKGYEHIRRKGEKVKWHKMVWNKWSIPKHGFITWIYHHNNMNTKDKLCKLGISSEDTCYMCALRTETIEHVFFDCEYSKAVIDLVGQQIGVQLPTRDILEWRSNRRGSKLKVDLGNAIVNACTYHIWRHRNLSKFELTLMNPRKVADTITEEMKLRLRGITLMVADNEKGWLRRLIGDRG
ncbi:uncharacterized protein LOC141614547 [Silene latifolia]|uniref:uncharacterized protein LOC141614547 n=1 Tax=Silene latifolia TaxID=37657 RepID=UPI003D77A067